MDFNFEETVDSVTTTPSEEWPTSDTNHLNSTALLNKSLSDSNLNAKVQVSKPSPESNSFMKTKKLLVPSKLSAKKPLRFAKLHPRPSDCMQIPARRGVTLVLACCSALFLTGSLASGLYYFRTAIAAEFMPPVSVVSSPKPVEPEVTPPEQTNTRISQHVPKMPSQVRPPTPETLPPTPPPPSYSQVISTQALMDESFQVTEMLAQIEEEEAAELIRKQEEEKQEQERLARLAAERKEQERIKAIARAEQAEKAKKEREIREAQQRAVAVQREAERKRNAEIAARANAAKQEQARQLAAQQEAQRRQTAEDNRKRQAAAQLAAQQAALAKKVAAYPSLKKRVSPKYPTSARKAGVEGTVKISVTVTSSGKVTSPRVVASSGNSSLDSSALSSVKRYRFNPAKNALGKAISYSGVIIPITFRME